MKITNWIFIFLAILLPFSIVTRSMINNKFLAMKDEVRINNIVDTATQDASDFIKEAADIVGEKNIDITPELALGSIKDFYRTLAVNFNIPFTDDENAIRYFEPYIPAIIIIGYDGFYVYSAETDGNTIKHELKPKIPYAYEDANGNIINFTLDNNITIFANGILGSGQKVFSGELYNEDYEAKYIDFKTSLGITKAEDFANITNDMSVILYALKQDNPGFDAEDFLTDGEPDDDYTYDVYGKLLNEAGPFQKKRREVITNSIKAALKSEVNEHNDFAKYLGVAYTFNIPDVSDVEWHNAINDISFLAFIQGIPIGTDSFYNNYALGGSRIIKSTDIYATDDGDGKRYHNDKCSKISNGTVIDYTKVKEIFLNNNDAAVAGYYPCPICRP